MAKKETPVNSNVNNNTNTNNINIKVESPKTRRSQVKKKQEPNWYTRTIIGGIIALALSLCGYYIKKNMDNKSKDDSILTNSQNK